MAPNAVLGCLLNVATFGVVCIVSDTYFLWLQKGKHWFLEMIEYKISCMTMLKLKKTMLFVKEKHVG